MRVTLAALGGGMNGTMTKEVETALRNARCIIGAKRLLDGLKEDFPAETVEAIRPEDILIHIQKNEGNVVVVYSGDTGFYSGARSLRPLLEREGIEAEVLPGISSVQLFSARIGRPWQDWNLVSAHGLSCDAVAAVCQMKPTFFLTGGKDTAPNQLCRQLTDAGLGGLNITVGENLSREDERITTGTAAELAEQEFASLSVVLAESARRELPRTPGWPDEVFLRDKVPMTKQEVRCAVLARLGVRPGETVWDIGAGTGSVSVELAFVNGGAPVYAVECASGACELIRQNREKFGAWNLRLAEGYAPEVLGDLPAPDAVFIGGTKGKMGGILDAILEKNPKARICISAIALETLQNAVSELQDRDMEPEICQIAVSRAKPAGSLHLLMANNPVFLITGRHL